MACKTETKEIDGVEYSVTQWSATKSITMKLRLAQAFGETIASIVAALPDSKNKKGSDEDNDKADAEALSKGFATLFNNNSPEQIVSLIKECVIGVARDGKKITDTSFEEIFSGDDLLLTYKVAVFTLQVNYGNLFKGQLAQRFLAKVSI